MSPGNVEFVQVVTSMLVVPATLAALLRFDEQRLDDARLERAWPPSTTGTVIFATWQMGILFGCPALVIWFLRTRRSALGALLGVGAAVLLLASAVAATVLPEVAIDWLGL